MHNKLQIISGALLALLLAACSQTPNTLSNEEVEREKARSDAMHAEMDRQTR